MNRRRKLLRNLLAGLNELKKAKMQERERFMWGVGKAHTPHKYFFPAAGCFFFSRHRPAMWGIARSSIPAGCIDKALIRGGGSATPEVVSY